VREKEGERKREIDRCIACRLVNLQFTTDSTLPEAVQPASQLSLNPFVVYLWLR